MKRWDLVKHLNQHACELMREGENHSIFVNRSVQKVTSVPRHREIDDFLCKKICRDLQIPTP